MNNITDTIHNNIDFQMCELEQLLDIAAPKTMAMDLDFMQIISIFTATFIGLISMGYGLFQKYFNHGFRLHFIGIARPNNFSKSEYKLLDNIDTESTMITINTSLKETDTISSLKNLIKKLYKICDKNDVLILYSHHIISEYVNFEELRLKDFNIGNNSLLTLAICDSNKIKQYIDYKGIQRDIIRSKPETEEPVNSVNEMFEMFEDDDDDENDDKTEENKKENEINNEYLVPFKGFDIITQEYGVLVYKMPICGHSMNKESLYQYALNVYKNGENIKLKCPHNENKGKCEAEWDYNAIIEILKHEYSKKEWIDFGKLELLSSRNKIENDCDVQKCPKCKSLYFKNCNSNKMKLADIKTVEDIKKEFKTQCILCKPSIITTTTTKEIENEEIDTTEAQAINAMFDMFQDEENDDDDKTNSFCFCCGVEWYKGHICDNSFRRDLCDILSKAELQKIGSVEGVPSIRCCPNCCQLLYHIDCCKHMQCKRCSTDFCHVCLKKKKDKKWQCGSSSTICPVAPTQNMQTLPNNIIITKKQFKLFHHHDND